MTEDEAISIATTALQNSGTSIGNRPIHAIRKDRHMRRGKHKFGWLVIIPLAVPESFEPNAIDVEVYEPDGEVDIPMVL